MALVSDNTTATGYGAPKPAPAPAPVYTGMAAPVPVYNGYVDDASAYAAVTQGATPPVAGGGPVITVPDAPAYRDPNNPNVVWDEQYQRWYDTKSGLWRNPDTGVWENFAGSQVWNPATGKMVAADKANVINPASIPASGAGVAAAKALIDAGKGKTNIVARPDVSQQFAALDPNTPYGELYGDVAGMFQGPGTPGVPERTGPISLAGLENVPAAWLDPARNAAQPVEPPGVSYLRDASGNVMYEQNIMGEWVPVERATMSGLEMLGEGLSALTASPYQLEEFDPVRERLPDFVNESIEFGTSPIGAASNVFLPFSGASSLGANIALNVAQDLAFGAAKVGAEKLGAPEPVAYGVGLLTGVASEAAVGRMVDKALTRGAIDALPPIRPRPDVPAAPVVDAFTGRDVRVLMPDGSAVPGVDFGPGAIDAYRAVQLPDGTVVDVQRELLEHLPPREPLTIARQVDDVLSDAPLADPRAAMAYPAENPVVPNLRPASAVDDVRADAQGVVRYKEEVIGRVQKGADGRWQAIDESGNVKVFTTKKSALESLGNDYDVARGARPVTSLIMDVRKAVDPADPAQREMADAITATVLDPSPSTVTRANHMAMSNANNVDFVGVNLADLAYVLGRDAEGNAITVKKLVEYRKIDDMVRNGVIDYDHPLYRMPKDLLNEDYKIRTGGQWTQNAKGEWKVQGGRMPDWLLPKGARDDMYDTRELHQTAMREAGMDNEMIRAILPEGPGLKVDGRYMHGSLLSYMSGKDWRRTLDLEKAALRARNSDELIRLKLDQAKIAGVNFNPFDPRTSYGLFSVADSARAKAIARAAVKDTALDVANEGSVANARAVAAQLGSASPVEMAIHEAEVAEIATRVLADTPEAVIPTSPQLKGLVEATKPESMKRTVARRTGTVAKETALAPIVGMRTLLLAGDFMIGRQLWGSLALYPKQTAKGIVDTLRNVRTRNAMWDYIQQVAEERPHLRPYLVTKGVPGSLEEEMTVGRWVQKVPLLSQIEDINGIMKNIVRINLDSKLVNMSEGMTEEMIAARARYIAVITGRGAGTFLDKHADKLNVTLFISSRYTASRFQFMGLLMPFYEPRSGMGMNAFADPGLYRAHIARMAAASTVALTAFTLLGTVPGVETVSDPRSSKFGKFKWKDNWYDFTGAFTDPIRLFTQMATLEGVSETGTVYKFDNPAKALQSYIEARIPPATRFVAERAGYVSPFQEKPTFPGQPSWMNRYIPLPVSSLVEIWRETNDLQDGFWNTLTTGATLAGFSVNPMGEKAKWEQGVINDKEAQKALQDDIYWKPGSSRKSFSDLSATGRAFVTSRPDIFGEKPTSGMEEFRRNAQIAADGKKAVRTSQLADDWKLEHGETSPKDWRKSESVRGRTTSQAQSGVWGEFDDVASDDVVDRYYAFIDSVEYQVGVDAEGNPVTDVDWEAVERWRGKLSDTEREALEEYERIQSGKGTPKQQEFDKARNTIEDSGFWTLKDQAYEVWRRDQPNLPETYDEWRDATFKAAYDAELAATGSPGMAYNAASKAQSALEKEMGFTDAYKNTVLYPWVQENPDAAKAAIDWQYYTPDNAAEKELFGGESTEIVSSQDTYRVKTTVTPLYMPTVTSAWHTWAGENVTATLSNGKGARDFQTVQEFKDALTADLETQKTTELGRALNIADKAAIGAQVADMLEPYIENTIAAGGISVKYVNSSGKSTTGYLSRQSIDELDAIVAAYKQNPDVVKEALRMGVIKDIGTVDTAYLNARGVSW